MPAIRWRHKRIVKIAVTITTLMIILMLASQLKEKVENMRCSNSESKQYLEELCELYQSGQLAGNLCADICNHQTLTFKSCLNYREGKKILVSDWKGQTVILKSKKAYFKQYDLLVGYEERDAAFVPTEEVFEKLVRDNIKLNLGFPIPEKEDILTKFWSSNFHSFLKSGTFPATNRAAINSLWSLIQQDEYIIIKSHQHSKHFPRIYGTCGHFYVIEYVPPGDLLSQELPIYKRSSSWKEQATTALALLALLKSFQNDLVEPLHLCDIKGENFGLTDGQEKVAKTIDMDMSFFNSKMSSEIVATKNCTSHSDCDFFDCKGWCVLPKSQCLDKRINNNLQAVCEKILVSNVDNAWQGILQSPPQQIENELRNLVRECANPGNLHSKMRYKASPHTHQKLETLLMKSLRYDSS